MAKTAETMGLHLMPEAIAAKHAPDGPQGTLLGADLRAFVNDDRWLAKCECGSAQVLSRDDRRFYCITCQVGWVRVIWPDDATVTAIEHVLGLRPRPYTRSWHPDQSVQELLEENRAHGLD